MSPSRVFSLILDPDLRCHVTKSAIRANPLMKSSQILSCGSLDIFPQSLLQVRQESNVCIISCMSHFAALAEGPSTISLRIDLVIQVRFVVSKLKGFIDSKFV